MQLLRCHDRMLASKLGRCGHTWIQELHVLKYLSIVFFLERLEQSIFVFWGQIKAGKVQHDNSEVVARLQLLAKLADFFDELSVTNFELLDFLNSEAILEP